ncbi:hypothetical protein DRE_04178 [Drechslerella stenobrocha 248]|uniref:Uncharacterized protein n=1 Tax=Drechslerella stenobrocha 248 TaxID=1043628 RepID=W7HRM3_9PEZI|nr:hypothetical protein DRE_04178 [Drechslerella stenobrocha 248]
MDITVTGDIKTSKRPVNLPMEGGPTVDSISGSVLIFPDTTYSNPSIQSTFYNMGHDTPHFHHHHLPTSKNTSIAEKLLWHSQIRRTFLCQNPLCSRLMLDVQQGRVKHHTSIPCFNDTCVNNLPETKRYGSVTCQDAVKHRCLPDNLGRIGNHTPGIPGHMFLETGIILFQPELIISDDGITINSQGAQVVVASEASGSRPKLPQPPLGWNRISFVAVRRFPSIGEAKRYLKNEYNYNPIILAEHENTGVAYDLTSYERLNYYRLLLWNQLDLKTQRDCWAMNREQELRTRPFAAYNISRTLDSTLKLGRRPKQDQGNASGTPGVEDGTDGIREDGTIIGTGDPWVWDFVHGRLPVSSLPWHGDPAYMSFADRASYASAKGYRIKEPSVVVHSGTHAMRSSQAPRPTYFTPVAPLADLDWFLENERRLQAVDNRALCHKARCRSEPPQDSKATELHTQTPADSAFPPSAASSLDNKVRESETTPVRGSGIASDFKIGTYDKMLPKVFYRPVPGGMLREECIQITKPCLEVPILVHVRQTFVKTGGVKGSGKGGQASQEPGAASPIGHDSTLLETSDRLPDGLSLNEEAELEGSEIEKRNVADDRESDNEETQRDHEENIGVPSGEEMEAIEFVIDPPGSNARTLSTHTVPSSVQLTPIRNTYVPRARAGAGGKERNTTEEANVQSLIGGSPIVDDFETAWPISPPTEEQEKSEVIAVKKRRGRKKKADIADLPFTNEDMSQDAIDEDEAWDIAPILTRTKKAGRKKEVVTQKV